MLKIHIDDRRYESFRVVEPTELKELSIPIAPLDEKMFHNDIFEYSNGCVKLLHSPTRTAKNLSGILILDNNKTYGKVKDKFLYRCVPDDKRLPEFIVPYLPKMKEFSKKLVNIYITFTFSNWDGKHPMGVIQHNIGGVNDLANFYEYQLYCKSLNASMSGFTRATSQAFKTQSHLDCIEGIVKKYPALDDRRDVKVISIDPLKSQDFDDALSYRRDGDYDIVSIYIANVSVWIEALGLWGSFSERVATIYLPDRKRPMLPTLLSDCLCSLVENEMRFALTIDLSIKGGMVESYKLTNSIIKVFRNYTYEEDALLRDESYIKIMESLASLVPNYKFMTKVKDSHDVVTYSMILMNSICADDMMQHKNGIYRSVAVKHSLVVPEALPNDVKDFIRIWNSYAGKYTYFQEDMKHELMKFDSYIHITSPIRRLVDLLNLINIQENHSLMEFGDPCKEFYKRWYERLDYINTTMRSIRRIQADCSMLHMCSTDPVVLSTIYEGYLFDCIERNDGLFQYMVYLPSIKLTNRVTLREELPEYTRREFKMYLFNDEANLKKKIRLQVS
ncbi:MAG: ribonuclease catalytic domain-containing protein [Candidatus Thorarchaeota archaeon]|jgi:exoribonuclease R